MLVSATDFLPSRIRRFVSWVRIGVVWVRKAWLRDFWEVVDLVGTVDMSGRGNLWPVFTPSLVRYLEIWEL